MNVTLAQSRSYCFMYRRSWNMDQFNFAVGGATYDTLTCPNWLGQKLPKTSKNFKRTFITCLFIESHLVRTWLEIYNTTTIQIKLGWALFVTYTIIQSIMRSEMCSLHLTHPSLHTWSSGQLTVQRPGSSRGLPVGAGIRTHNLGLPRVSSPPLYPLGQRLPI